MCMEVYGRFSFWCDSDAKTVAAPAQEWRTRHVGRGAEPERATCQKVLRVPKTLVFSSTGRELELLHLKVQ